MGPRTQKRYGEKSLTSAENRSQIPRSPISQSNHYTGLVYCGDVSQIRINYIICSVKFAAFIDIQGVGDLTMYVVGSKSFRPDIHKPRQMENAVRDI